MSEGLAEVMLLSSGYMSIERPVIAWSSRLRNRRSTFSNRRWFYKQTANLSFKQLHSHLKYMAARRGTSGVDTVLLRLLRRNEATSASDRRPSAP